MRLSAARPVSAAQRHRAQPGGRLAVARPLRLAQDRQGRRLRQAEGVERAHLPGLPPSSAAAAQEVVQLELHQPLHQTGGQRQYPGLTFAYRDDTSESHAQPERLG